MQIFNILSPLLEKAVYIVDRTASDGWVGDVKVDTLFGALSLESKIQMK